MLGKEIVASSTVKETNREYFYISQSYLNLGNQKKANKFQTLAKEGLLKSSEKISDLIDNFLPGEGVTDVSIQVHEEDNPDIEMPYKR